MPLARLREIRGPALARKEIFMRISSISQLCLFAVLIACSDKGSDSGNPPARSNGLPLEFRDLRTGSTSLTATERNNLVQAEGNLNSIRVFRFEVTQKSRFEVTGLNRTFENCNGEPQVRIELRPMPTEKTLGEVLGELGLELETELAPGRYAVSVQMASGVQCSKISVGFDVSLTAIAAEDDASTDQPAPNPEQPASDPDADERFRIAQGFLKDETTLRFWAFTSPAAGCEPVFTRSIAQLKGEALGRTNGALAKAGFIEDRLGGLDVQLTHSDFLVREFASLRLIKQTNYPTTWVQDIRKAMVSTGGTVNFALERRCESTGRYWVQNLHVVNGLPVVYSSETDNEEKLPLASTTLASGKPAPDANFRYSYGASTTWKADLGLDSAEILQATGGRDNIIDVAWMVGNRWSDVPFSDWNPMPTTDLLGADGRARLDAGNMAERLLYRPFEKSIIFRIRHNGRTSMPSPIFYVLDHGRLCSLAYTRDDGALFHQQLFTDLTNPAWNANPNRDAHQGCGYAGARWWD